MKKDYLKDFKNHCLTCEKYGLDLQRWSTQRGFWCNKHNRCMAHDEYCPSYRFAKFRTNDEIESAMNWRMKKGYRPSPDKSHWYVTSEICKILGYSDDCEYMEAFDFMQSGYMRETDDGKDDLLRYEVYGPAIAGKLDEAYNDPKRQRGVIRLCKEILEPYLTLILNLIKAGNFECALLTYKQMVDMLAQRYNVFLEELHYSDEERKDLEEGMIRKRICPNCPIGE